MGWGSVWSVSGRMVEWECSRVTAAQKTRRQIEARGAELALVAAGYGCEFDPDAATGDSPRGDAIKIGRSIAGSLIGEGRSNGGTIPPLGSEGANLLTASSGRIPSPRK